MRKMHHKYIGLLISLLLSACSGGGGGDSEEVTPIVIPPVIPTVMPTSINQAVYTGSNQYDYGANGGIPNLSITSAPADTDFSRSAMLHDGSTYRLYFFKNGTDDTLYQFGYNSATQDYEYGYSSINVLKITGKPADADPGSFAMLHDGTTFRLYMRSKFSVTTMYQFAWNGSSYAYGHNSIPQLYITGSPADADHSRWAMLHDGTRYRLYTGKQNVSDTIYQYAFNAASTDYEYGFDSIVSLNVTDMPADSIKSNFMMNHGGSRYRFYYLSTK